MYDYKSKNIIQYYIFDNVEDLAFDILCEYDKLRHNESLNIFCTKEELSVLLSFFMDSILYSRIDKLVSLESIDKMEDKILINFDWDGTIFVQDAISNNNLVFVEDDTLIYISEKYLLPDILKLEEKYNNILAYSLKNKS